MVYHIYSFIGWWTFELFSFMTTMNKAAMNICVKAIVWTCFNSLEYIHRSRILGHMVTLCLNFVKLSNVFQSGCTSLRSHQQCMRFQFLHILTRTCYCLFILFILIDMKGYLTIMWFAFPWYIMILNMFS